MIHVDVEEDQIIVGFQYDADIISAIKSLPNRKWDPVRKVWTIPLLDYPKLAGVLGIEVQKVFEKYQEAIEERKEIDSKREELLQRDVNFDLKGGDKLKKYQEESVNFLLLSKNCILNLDIGLGKTIVAIVAGLLIKKQQPRFRDLIVCPASLKYHWASEIEKYTDETYTIVEGDFEDRKIQYLNSNTFTIVNYELVRMEKDLTILKNIPWNVITADEITRIKNMKTRSNKALRQLIAGYRWGLTGSPIENKLTDLYSIMRWINPSVFGNYWGFRERFMIFQKRVMGYKSWQELVGYKNLDEIKERMKNSLIRKQKREVLSELPPRVERLYYVNMTAQQWGVYNAIKDEMLQMLGKDINPLAKLTYLRECVNSPETIGMKGKSGKIEELKGILDEIGDQKVIVFSQFVKACNVIMKEIKGRKIIFVSGADGSEGKFKKVEQFKESPEGTILLSTDCMSYGQNLQFCNILVNFDLPFNPIKLENRIGRIDRLGQENKVLVINLIAKNTVEERVWEILQKKKDLIQKLIGLDYNPNAELKNKSFIKFLLEGD